MKFRRDARQHGEEGVDGDVGKRVREPGELLKVSGERGRGPIIIRRGGKIIFYDGWLGNFFQPECQNNLSGDNDGGNMKNALVAKFFDECAADKQRRRIGRRPSDVVDADGVRDAVGRFIFADEGFEDGPGKTHSERDADGGGDLADGGTELRADEQAADHEAEAKFERVEISPALREATALPR